MRFSKKWSIFAILISFQICSFSILISSKTFAQNDIAGNSLFSSLSRDLNSTIDGIQNNELTNNNDNNNTQSSQNGPTT